MLFRVLRNYCHFQGFVTVTCLRQILSAFMNIGKSKSWIYNPNINILQVACSLRDFTSSDKYFNWRLLILFASLQFHSLYSSTCNHPSTQYFLKRATKEWGMERAQYVQCCSTLSDVTAMRICLLLQKRTWYKPYFWLHWATNYKEKDDFLYHYSNLSLSNRDNIRQIYPFKCHPNHK